MADRNFLGGGGESTTKIPFIPLSPPKCEVDDTPLHGKCLNKNKESLKVKLMLRRPRHDLISRGVIPAVSTSYNFYEQRQKLEMAKKHDILKYKMQRRPLREELVRQHILEDSPNNIAPALVEKQKQLKRARIADTISDHLCQRPGPLELVKANILHTSEDLEKAVKEGQLLFKSTCEGETRKHPSLYLLQEDESSSEAYLSPEQSEGGSGRASRESSVTPITLPFGVTTTAQIVTSPQSLIISPSSFASLTSLATLPTSVTSLPSGVTILTSSTNVVASPLTSNTSSMSPLSSIASPVHHIIPSPQTPSITPTLLVAQTPIPHALTTPPLQNSAPGKDQSKNRKKSKGKSQPKTRTIKFHEYKGPPSAAKKDTSVPIETSYDILLHQQNLFLQCQLELKKKYTKILFPAGLKASTGESTPGGVTLSSLLTLGPTISHSSTSHTPIAPAPPSNVPPAPPPPPNKMPSFRLPTKLEELKVSELKTELKKRNLPVSGSKPNLIERLKHHTKATAPAPINSNPGSNSNKNSESSVDGDIDFNASLFTPRSSVDFTDDASVSGLLEASMEVGEESIASPTYSQISTRPNSVAPMDVDFDLSMEVNGPLTPVNTFLSLDDLGSINTPPPPPPPPPVHNFSRGSNGRPDIHYPAQQFLSPSEAAERPQEGIQQLQQKIEDLQKQLRDTQMQLQVQQQHNMIKAQELYKRNYNDTKLSQKDLLRQQLDNRKQIQQQRQLQSHMEQLQQNLKKEQKQLAKNVTDDKFDSLEELLQFHSSNKEPTPAVQEHPYQQQYALITEQLPENSLRVQQPVAQHAFRVSGYHQIKNGNEWVKMIPAINVASSSTRNQRPSSVATSNGQMFNTHHRQVGMTSSLPNFNGSQYSQSSTITLPDLDLSNFDVSPVHTNQPEAQVVLKAPPNYSEAVKVSNDSQPPVDHYTVSYKNQQVDDVLEILIKNGEISPDTIGDISLSHSTPRVGTIDNVEMDLNRGVPPPPPPPPPIKQSRNLANQNFTSTSNNFQGVSSPSVFADLVIGANSPEVNIDLDLPVFNGIEMNHVDNNPTVDKRKENNLPDIKMEMGQDLDVASWINSLTSTPSVSFAQPCATASWISLMSSNQSAAKPQQNVANNIRSSSSASSSSSGYSSNMHQSDPLLGSNSDQLDFFSIDEIDFKTPSQNVHELTWDRLDFTT